MRYLFRLATVILSYKATLPESGVCLFFFFLQMGENPV